MALKGQATEYVYNFILQQWVQRHENEAEDDEDESENKLEIKRAKNEKMQAMKDEALRLKLVEKSDGATTTSIFVSGLPPDVTSEELNEVFSKYGVISEDFKTGLPRIKLYYENDQFKNEALVTYHNKESVNLAVDMLDKTKIRPSKHLQPISVQMATFQEEKREPKERRVLTAEEKSILQKKKELLKRKVSGWGDEDPSGALDRAQQIRERIWKKSLVIKNMFRPEELKTDSFLEADITEDIKSECDKYGIGSSVSKVSFHGDEGVVLVRFDLIEAASQCMTSFNGRYYDGLKLQAREYAGEKFQ